MFSVAGPWDTLSHISPKSPMIKSKPASLPSNWFHSQLDSHSNIYSGSSGIIISNVPRNQPVYSKKQFIQEGYRNYVYKGVLRGEGETANSRVILD